MNRDEVLGLLQEHKATLAQRFGVSTLTLRAVESCETTGYDPDSHFRGVTKMVRLGSGAERAIDQPQRPTG